MNGIRTLIVDDEPVARAGLRTLLGNVPDVTVVGEAADGETAVQRIRTLSPDLVLLDIQMPGMNGFDVLQAVGAEAVPAVVFVTAYDQFAVRAFEIQALDYLLKPFEDERFAAVLDRVREHLRRRGEGDLARRLASLLAEYEARTAAAGSAAQRPPAVVTDEGAGRGSDPAGAQEDGEGRTRHGPVARLLIRSGGRVSFQPVDEIDWIEAADYYARLHVGRQTHLVRETLSSLEMQLDRHRFVRIHRSAIVNVARVAEVRLDWRNRHIVVLRGGTELPLSRRRKEMLEIAMRGG